MAGETENSDGGAERGAALNWNKDLGGVLNCAPGDANNMGVPAYKLPLSCVDRLALVKVVGEGRWGVTCASIFPSSILRLSLRSLPCNVPFE